MKQRLPVTLVLAAAAITGAIQQASASTWWPPVHSELADPQGDSPVGATDIVTYGADYVGGKLTLNATVASHEDPAGQLWRDTDTGITWLIDVGPDDGAEFEVGYYNDGSGVVAEVYAAGGTLVCTAEPLFLGGRYVARVDASCIGNPAAFGVATVATDQSGTIVDVGGPGFMGVTRQSARSGYWMVGADGQVYAFGQAATFGGRMPFNGTTQRIVDLEPTPSHNGCWLLSNDGLVVANGSDALPLGSVDRAQLQPREETTSISATPTGNGYWIFTSTGRMFAFGDAKSYGDMSGKGLNAPVLDSIATPTGKGYYMVASDGGIFAFGDAAFRGSMGDKHLNAPVQSLVPDPDGDGYWLVASDGGIFAFAAGFHGSMGDRKLNKPVTGMVPYGDGYLMVAEDGGIFSFSNQPFLGSLGANPPSSPITSVAVLDES